jgi:hypothetical protein
MNPNFRTNTNLDRRQTFRKVPEKFAFIQLERDDGGAVLNVSEGGLSFSTFAPVYQKTGRFTFGFRSILMSGSTRGVKLRGRTIAKRWEV